MTEIRLLNTYWSDHCCHTTFSTELKKVEFGEGDYKEPIVGTYEKYLADRAEIFKGREDKFVYLMDLALMAMRKLKKEVMLESLVKIYDDERFLQLELVGSGLSDKSLMGL